MCWCGVFKKMKAIIVGVLAAVSFCLVDDLICELFDQNLSSIEYYCSNFRSDFPEDCSGNTTFNEVIKIEIKRLNVGGCDTATALNTIRKFPNIQILDISHSGYDSLNWFDVKLNSLELFNASHNALSRLPFGFSTKHHS